MNRKAMIFPVLIFLLITISSCSKKAEGNVNIEEIRTGTQGIIVNFMANNPPPELHVTAQDNIFTATLEIKNSGAYPQPDDTYSGLGPKGKLYLSGYDPNIIKFQVKEQNQEYVDLSRLNLEGKSALSPAGGMDIVSFVGTVQGQNLNVKTYEPTILATSCYLYQTVASPGICIDPIPYSSVPQKKVCEIKDLTLASQGAPIAVIRIDEEAFSTKTQFKITFKNVGGGDVIKEEAIEKCSPPSSSMARIEREDLDKIHVLEVVISNTPLTCGPFTDDNVKATSGYVKLINGEGSIVCELDGAQYSDKSSSYTTPMIIKLEYGYRSSAQRTLKIIKED